VGVLKINTINFYCSNKLCNESVRRVLLRPTVKTTSTTPSTTRTTAAQTTTVVQPLRYEMDYLTHGKAASIFTTTVEVNMTVDWHFKHEEWIKTGNPAKIRMEVAAAGQTTASYMTAELLHVYACG